MCFGSLCLYSTQVGYNVTPGFVGPGVWGGGGDSVDSDLYVCISVFVKLSIFIRCSKFISLQNDKGLFVGKKTISGNTSPDLCKLL